MHFVYILKSQHNNSLYVGFTSDLEKRLKMHNSGESGYTRKYTPWTLVYMEGYLSDKDARHRERSLKRYAQGLRRIKERIGNSLVA